MVLEHPATLSIPPLRGNPFDTRPIEGSRISEIVGRDKVLTSWRELIISGSPRMVLLSGERGSGRTSLINALCSFSPNNIVCQYWPEENQLLSVIHEISISFDGFEKSTSIHRVSDGLVRNLESKNGPLPIVALDYPSNISMEDFLPRITPILQRLRALVIISLTPSQLNALDTDTINLFDQPLLLKELNIDDIQKLVDKRVRKMGKERWILNPNLLKLIHEKSGGNPRLIVNLLQNLIDENRGIGSKGALERLYALDSTTQIKTDIIATTKKLGRKPNKISNFGNVVPKETLENNLDKFTNNDSYPLTKSDPFNNLEIQEEPINTKPLEDLISENSIDFNETPLEIVENLNSKNDDFTLIDWNIDSKDELTEINSDEVKFKDLNTDLNTDLTNKKREKQDSNSLNNNNNNNNNNKLTDDYEEPNVDNYVGKKLSKINNFGGIIGRSRKTINSKEFTDKYDDINSVYIDASRKEEKINNSINHQVAYPPENIDYGKNMENNSDNRVVDITDEALWTVESNKQSTLPPEPVYIEPVYEDITYEEEAYQEPVYEKKTIPKEVERHILQKERRTSLGSIWNSDNRFDRDYVTQLSDAENLIISKAKNREISPSDNELQALLQVGRPRLSQIYNKLNKAGILSVRKKGRSRMFKLSDTAKNYF
jgi:DNA-binding transcriptional ArsR family regulator